MLNEYEVHTSALRVVGSIPLGRFSSISIHYSSTDWHLPDRRISVIAQLLIGFAEHRIGGCVGRDVDSPKLSYVPWELHLVPGARRTAIDLRAGCRQRGYRQHGQLGFGVGVVPRHRDAQGDPQLPPVNVLLAVFQVGRLGR